MHMLASTREIHRSLARRISPADDDHFLLLAAPRLGGSRCVVDAGADEPGCVFQRQLAVLRARRNDDASCTDCISMAQIDGVGPLTAVELHRRVRSPDL